MGDWMERWYIVHAFFNDRQFIISLYIGRSKELCRLLTYMVFLGGSPELGSKHMISRSFGDTDISENESSQIAQRTFPY